MSKTDFKLKKIKIKIQADINALNGNSSPKQIRHSTPNPHQWLNKIYIYNNIRQPSASDHRLRHQQKLTIGAPLLVTYSDVKFGGS
jgi:hypothetical protein